MLRENAELDLKSSCILTTLAQIGAILYMNSFELNEIHQVLN